ncbi:esterase/lipase family protein [Rhodococcus sp. NPDC057297]|uniref:esterase/lipase family protein n=1 Tax=Rhodococcus sp. NPDC057297 TaxID=3346090 RepID=UPI00363707F0
MNLRENVGRALRGIGATSIAVAAVLNVEVATAAASPSACATPTVLVHDLASSEREWDGWLDDLDRRGLCAFSFTYGSSDASALLQQAGLTVSGLTSIEDSALEFGAFVASVRERTGADRVQVLARGAGGLVAQQWVARSRAQDVRTLVTVGPLWNGTDVAGLGSLAAFNRSIGIYDALAAVEKPLLEPSCAACGQIVANSGYMHDAARAGWVSPGVRYVNVISRYDGLMTDPLSAALPGSENLVVQDVDPEDRSDHLHLSNDPLVRRLALGALAVG